MIVENLSTYGNSVSHEVLAHAQTIANHFIDAIEQNDCTLKILVGFYYDVDDTINGLEDLVEALEQPSDEAAPEAPKEAPRGSRPVELGISPRANLNAINTPAGMDAAISALNDKCFNCKLGLPKLKFDKNFDFHFERLGFQIELYKEHLKLDGLKLMAYCHTSYAMQRACVPDILKIISMLLTAFSAMMALNKLPKITLGAFVKAIIGKLMASVVANIQLSVDMSQTGIPCVLDAIEEIARAIPTKQDVWDLEMSDEVRNMIFPREPYKGLSGETKQPFIPQGVFLESQAERLKNREITKEQYDKELEEYRKRNEPLRYYAEQARTQVEGKMDEAESKILDAFGKVSGVITKAQDDINAYIQAILGIIEYFECENSRTGPDFSELFAYIKNIQEVINLFSAILGKWLTKAFEPLICGEGHVSVGDALNVPMTPLSPQDIADIYQEFTGNEAKLSADGNSILIYDKKKPSILPKLSLTGCNFKEFAEAHQLDNAIKAVTEHIADNPDRYPPRGLPRVGVDFEIPRVPAIGNTLKTPVDLPEPFVFKPIDVELPTFPRSPVRPMYPRLKGWENIITLVPTSPGATFPNPTLPINTKPYLDLKVPARTSILRSKGSSVKADQLLGLLRSSRDNPIHVFDVGSGLIDFGAPAFLESLDSLLDYIYDPPVPKDTPIEPEVFSFRDNTTSSRYVGPRDRECATFEDVLEVLNTLRI